MIYVIFVLPSGEHLPGLKMPSVPRKGEYVTFDAAGTAMTVTAVDWHISHHPCAISQTVKIHLKAAK